jgi:hypothetical protein
LIRPAKTTAEYEKLFRLLQPVSPVAFTRPGEPPRLVHRAGFDDKAVTSDWRETRKIVKGRFLGGTIGYVFGDELELYANAFQRPLTRLNRNQGLILDTIIHAGPLTPRQIKEETGLLNKEIMPILHRLQQAFLVYEDQLDTDWERPWYGFSQEWPDISIAPENWEAAARKVLQRFIQSQVFVTEEQIKDWSGWLVKDIKHLLQLMLAKGDIKVCRINGLGEGWISAEEKTSKVSMSASTVFMLHKADPLVRANSSELKRRYTGLEVLQYLLIDSEFRGAVCGHWHIGPYDIKDIVVDLSLAERESRKAEILAEVAWGYQPPNHHILRYAGESSESPVKKTVNSQAKKGSSSFRRI